MIKISKYHFFLLFFFLTIAHSKFFGQSVTGGAGVTHVSGDPDDISITQDVDVYESNICFDPTNQIVYFYNPSGTAGVNQWEGVSVTSFSNTDTRLTNPTVSGGNLVFDILNVITNTTTGSVSVPILDIAPVQSVVGSGDIVVSDNGSGTYTVSFTESITSLSISGDTLRYTDENGTLNKITLPTSDGSDTKVTGGGDVSVSGTGTSGDPYVVSFTETTTALTISSDTLKFTDEDGTVNKVTLPTSDGSDTQVTGGGDVSVSGTGTSGDPYIVSFTETTTSLAISADTLRYTDEDGTVNKVTLPTSDGSDTQVTGGGDVSVSGSGTSGDPYVVSFTEATSTLSFSSDTLRYTDENGSLTKIGLNSIMHEPVTVNDGSSIDFTASGTDNQTITAEITGVGAAASGSVLTADGSGGVSWSSANITSIAADTNGRLIATLASGATVIFDLDSAPRVDTMTQLEAAANALTSGQTGIAVADDGNVFGLPANDDSNMEVGVLFFIKKK